MYEIRVAGAKGLGVFAKQLIPRGTRIFSERPLLSIGSDQDGSNIYAAARQLTTKDRNELMKLSFHSDAELTFWRWNQALWYTIKSTTSTVLGMLKREKRLLFPKGGNSIRDHVAVLSIFRSNSFNLGRNTQMIQQAVFPRISRINHACVPNAQGNFHEGLGKFNVHATRDIEADEEVSLNYLAECGALREARMSKLSSGYGFECGCAACNLGEGRGRNGEERREVMGTLLRKFAEEAVNGGVRNQKAELKTIQAFIELYEGEGIAGRELSTL